MNDNVGKLDQEKEAIYAKLQPIRDQTNLVEDLRAKRDELNSKVQDLSKQAKTLKAERDKFNQLVFDEKNKRDSLNDQKNTLRTDIPPKNKNEYRKLQETVKNLQFKIERSGVSFEEEKKIRKQLSGLQSEYMRMKNFARLRTRASEYHKKIKELSLESNRTHSELVKLYDQIKAIRATADEAHNSYVEAIERLKEIKDTYTPDMQRLKMLKSQITQTKGQAAATERFEIQKSMKERADEAVKLFESGKKVDLRDLQLQIELEDKKAARRSRSAPASKKPVKKKPVKKETEKPATKEQA